MRVIQKLLLCLACICLLQAAATASIEFVFNGTSEFSGSGSVFGGSVGLSFDDSGGSGSVVVELDGSLFTGPAGAYISGLYLNYDPAKNATVLMDDDTATAGNPNLTNVSYGMNAFKADGDGFFDIQIDWQTSGGAGRFGPGETDTITFSLAGLVEEDFDFVSVNGSPGKNGFSAALRVRALDDPDMQGPDNEGSGWFFATRTPPPPDPSDIIPEPVSAMVWSFLAMLGVGVSRRR